MPLLVGQALPVALSVQRLCLPVAVPLLLGAHLRLVAETGLRGVRGERGAAGETAEDTGALQVAQGMGGIVEVEDGGPTGAPHTWLSRRCTAWDIEQDPMWGAE